MRFRSWPIEPNVAPLLFLAAQVCDAGEQHAAGAAGGVIDGFAGLRFQHFGHEMDDGAVGVEFGGGVAGVVGEFFDKVFVSLAQLVFGQIGESEFQRAEMLDRGRAAWRRTAGLCWSIARRQRCRRACPGLAVSMARMADWSAVPTFLAACRTLRQCASSGTWKRWFSGYAANWVSPPDSFSAVRVSSSNTSHRRL